MTDTNHKKPETKVCWFVGANFGGTEDQTSRFINEGIWETLNPGEKDVAFVKSMQPGDPIAIKSAYVRKHNLPFNNRGNSVSVMAIKAIGTVKENPGNGFSVLVDWSVAEPIREWYFYTYRSTIWRVLPGDWAADGLIEFTFEGKEQDIDRFRNASYWKERFGDNAVDKRRFKWTGFYETFADKLLSYRNNRSKLIAKLHELSASTAKGFNILNDELEKGIKSPLEDICPFTVIGLFNRGITDENRINIASELKKFLEIDESVPNSFEGIPLLNNQNTWLFSYAYKRQDDDIETLWEIFSKAIEFADSNDEESRSEFIKAYNDAIGRNMVGWKLSMGLYWVRPWTFTTLDNQSREYIEKKLNIQIGMNGPKGRCNAEDYLTVLDILEARFKEDGYPVHSFPELSLAAWHFKDNQSFQETDTNNSELENDDADIIENIIAPIEPYSLDNILTDGCFVERDKLKTILERLRTKKNLILQGPPGTGKTWLAKRLAFALMGERDDSKLRAVQFHPNLSYEDFIRGWRPMGDGKLTMVDGPFLEIMKSASKEATSKYVVVIEEINRGNPAQIFGEMLTLLEVDKRTPNEALELSYKRSDGERLFIPDNLYVIGTMNVADRSLALVDFALRRRFAFIDLEPSLGKLWRDWVQSQCGIDPTILIEIEKRILTLNNEISDDTSLGPQFRIGHSYVTPPFGIPINDAREWFRQVVETEIAPLLDEYWFDGLDKAKKAKERLLEGF
ncbi:AAA ATPase superfamily [Desulfamplus magnetovallimortis]|uniref:AAA ATPase superfamily n=1 Tax=Desulfamplus magnetovallimortis TaxID=1246637 RepID=A0A1W1H8J6_9BACT|nr:AAA family ATPase [Desulfamplus magnetovallimortis]SLM28756.1 AAA ATPase superfamily [Desulfamplus magnetovallimortis]